MHRSQILLLALAVGFPVLIAGHAQDSVNTSSSDDISVADGLQLPLYGHIWALDTWKGVRELVQLETAQTTGHAWPPKLHRPLEIQGEAAKVRVHDTLPEIFLRKPPMQAPSASSPFIIVRLTVTGQSREITKPASDDLVRERKRDDPQSEDVIELNLRPMSIANWYRLIPARALTPDEYAIVPLPGSQGTSPDEIYDFAVDPEAPENPKPVRSERDRPDE
jgi:hypothetical protein